MTEHTPGPWKRGTCDSRLIWVGETELVACAYTDADARLIAAAPDLLAALRELVSASNSVNETVGDRDENDRAINRLIAATSKAMAAITMVDGL